MTAFEQAWALLKSTIHDGMTEEEYFEMLNDEKLKQNMQNLTDDDFSNPNNAVLLNNPEYYWDDFFKNWFRGSGQTINPDNSFMSPVKRPQVRDSFRFNRQAVLPIDREEKLPENYSIRPVLLKPPTPLEERVADRPPVSHIEWNPNTNKYTLRGTGDEELSTLKPGMPMGTSPFPEGDMALHNILGETPKQFRRKRYYEKLMRGLLNAGIDIYSDDRNRQSNPFHQKFLDNLPPNLEAINNSDASGKIGYFDPIHYRRKPLPESFDPEAYGDLYEFASPEEIINLSDLTRRDYGAIPIRSLPIKPEYVKNPIGTRQTKLDEFRPPPPPTLPEGEEQ